MIIKVLGPGCANCRNLERVTREALADLGLDATVEKVLDYPTIVGYGVLKTPALDIDEKLVLSGRVPRTPEVRDLIAAAFARASSSISRVMSTPNACPDGPTRLAESSTSIPAPDPRSRTTSPRVQLDQCRRVSAPQRGGHRSLGQVGGLLGRVQVAGDRILRPASTATRRAAAVGRPLLLCAHRRGADSRCTPRIGAVPRAALACPVVARAAAVRGGIMSAHGAGQEVGWLSVGMVRA